jgi:hypothetical protein
VLADAVLDRMQRMPASVPHCGVGQSVWPRLASCKLRRALRLSDAALSSTRLQ